MIDTTGNLIAATIVIALAYDLYAYRRSGGQATISNWVRVMSRDWPIIPFLAGMLAGHFFFYG